MKEQIRICLISILLFTCLFGLAYPFTVYVIGQFFFPNHTQGGMIRDASERVIGAKLIGQKFESPQYFHPRPSSAGEQGYDAMASDASNLGPTSKQLIDLIQERIQSYRIENNLSPTEPIPADAVTASGSGLDPHISLQNAYLQATRVAMERSLSLEIVRSMIRKETSRRWLGVFGEKRVNVLMLNFKLDQIN